MHRHPLANYSKFKTQWKAYEGRRKTGKGKYLDYKNCYNFVNALGKEHVEGRVKNTNHQ
jgi:hypothetical protein